MAPPGNLNETVSGVVLTEAERSILTLYQPQTYCIQLAPFDGRAMEKRGLLEWVPAPGWAGQHNYAITEAGRAAIDTSERPAMPRVRSK